MTAEVIALDDARPTCSACGDRVFDDRGDALCRTCDREEIERRRADYIRRRDAEIDQRIERGIAPLPRWPHARTESDVWPRISPRLRRWAETWGPRHGSALLLGPSGCGKTTAIVATIYRLAEEARAAARSARVTRCDELSVISGVRWASARQLATCRRSHPLGEGEPQELEAWRNASVLVIDELGFESREPEPDIFGLIDDRYTRHRPTVVTSGMTVGELIARYGVSLVRRLTDTGIGTLVNCHPAKGSNG